MNGQKTLQFFGILPMEKVLARIICPLLLWTSLGGGFTSSVRAGEAPSLQLIASVPVSADGVFLPQLFTSTQPLPVIRLADAPEFGRNLILTRAQICDLLAANAPGVGAKLTGPAANNI
jgi:hypothetical protein